MNEQETHTCEACLDGEWIIFTCPQCAGYERRVNWRTRAMVARCPDGTENIRHIGNYWFPYSLTYSFRHRN